MITTLRIKKTYKSKLDMAVKWYSILSILNDFKWSPIKVKLMAFTAIEGNVSSGGKRERFCSIYKSTKNSIANSIGELKEDSFLVKLQGKISVHPQLFMDFNNDIVLNLNLENETSKSDD